MHHSKTFPLPTGNNEMKVFSYTGVVIGEPKKTYETHVSGGGGRIDTQLAGNQAYTSGHIDSIQSSSSLHLEFWLKLDDGKEESFQFTNCDFPLREGHRVTAVYAGASNQKKYSCAYIVNHANGSSMQVSSTTTLTADIYSKETGTPRRWIIIFTGSNSKLMLAVNTIRLGLVYTVVFFIGGCFAVVQKINEARDTSLVDVFGPVPVFVSLAIVCASLGFIASFFWVSNRIRKIRAAWKFVNSRLSEYLADVKNW